MGADRTTDGASLRLEAGAVLERHSDRGNVDGATVSKLFSPHTRIVDCEQRNIGRLPWARFGQPVCLFGP